MRPTERSPATPAGCAADSTWRQHWWWRRRCCSSTSRPPAWTRRAGARCGRRSGSWSSGGTTVLLTTQYLEEADQLADRISMLRGRRGGGHGYPGRSEGVDRRRLARVTVARAGRPRPAADPGRAVRRRRHAGRCRRADHHASRSPIGPAHWWGCRPHCPRRPSNPLDISVRRPTSRRGLPAHDGRRPSVAPTTPAVTA